MTKTGHYFIVVLLALIAGFIGATLNHGKNHSINEKKETAYERVMRTGTIRCGYALWPPNILNKDPNTGKLFGALYDITEKAAANLSLKVVWAEETGWGTWPEGLNSGRFDVFCSTGWHIAATGRSVRFVPTPIFYNPVYGYARINDMRFNDDAMAANSPNANCVRR